MNKAYILMGGNVGNTFKHLQQARSLLNHDCGTITQQSSVYETAPWGKADQQNFLNQAILLLTTFSAQQLMTAILDIEEKMGRRRQAKYGPRLIDIDILLFNDSVIHETRLTIPHPQLPYRRFALVPLAEIAPETEHPELHKTIGELLLECPDQLDVALYRLNA